MGLDAVLPATTRILIVDDVKSARLALCATLQALGYCDIVQAENGEEAWEKLVKMPEVGLIITDWQMPKLEGLGLADRVVNDVRFQNVPIVIATQKGDWQDLAQATVAGVWGYIVKPVSVDSVRQELEDVMIEQQERIAECAMNPYSV